MAGLTLSLVCVAAAGLLVAYSERREQDGWDQWLTKSLVKSRISFFPAVVMRKRPSVRHTSHFLSHSSQTISVTLLKAHAVSRQIVTINYGPINMYFFLIARRVVFLHLFSKTRHLLTITNCL